MNPRHPRMAHGGVARIVAPGVSWTGRAMNLSLGGAFLTGGPELDIGMRLTVSIELGDGHPPIAAHARVAWVRRIGQGEREAGMGVKFLRLDQAAMRRVTALMDAHLRAHHRLIRGPVRVVLPGLPSKLRASACELHDTTLVVESELSWLKIGATISTEVAPGDVRDGRLAWVGVEVAPSGHARLCLHVELDDPIIEIVAEPEQPIAEARQ